MRRFILPLVTIPVLLLVTACEPTVEDYVKNSKLREDKLRECTEMGVMAAKEDKYCQMAMEAQGIVIKQAAGNLVDAITLQQSDEEKEKKETR